MLPLFLLFSCSNPALQEEYEARKAAALSAPGEVPKGWEAEGALRMCGPAMEQMLGTAIARESKAARPMDVKGMGTIKPVLELKSFKLIEPACKECVGTKGRLEGNAEVKVAGIKTKIPFKANFEMDLRFSSEQRGERRHIVLTPQEVRKLKVKFEGAAPMNLSGVVEKYGAQVLAQIDPVDLGDLGGPELHLRDARVVGDGGCMRIELLTDAPEPAAVGKWPKAPEEGWQAVVSEEALLAIARREAFALGDVADGMGIYAEPTSLDVDGDAFTLGLRVWRLGGPDWWRDYTLKGSLAVKGQELVLAADEVIEGPKSEGAGVADPLALVGEAYLMRILQDSAQGALPAADSFSMGSSQWSVVTEDARGVGDSLVISGKIQIGKSKKAR